MQQNNLPNRFTVFKQLDTQETYSELFSFMAWRIWKSRIDLIYNNKQWSIPNIINKSIADFNAWREVKPRTGDRAANVHSFQQSGNALRCSQGTILQTNQVHPPFSTQYHCYVDASWINVDTPIGLDLI